MLRYSGVLYAGQLVFRYNLVAINGDYLCFSKRNCIDTFDIKIQDIENISIVGEKVTLSMKDGETFICTIFQDVITHIEKYREVNRAELVDCLESERIVAVNFNYVDQHFKSDGNISHFKIKYDENETLHISMELKTETDAQHNFELTLDNRSSVFAYENENGMMFCIYLHEQPYSAAFISAFYTLS